MATCYPERRASSPASGWPRPGSRAGESAHASTHVGRGNGGPTPIKLTGELPTSPQDPSVLTFAMVALECKAVGGPRKRKWKSGRDHSVEQRVGGPGCLNNFSASISGASAEVRLPSGVAAG